MTTIHLRGETLSFSAEPCVEPDVDQTNENDDTAGITHHNDAVITLQDGTIASVQDARFFAEQGGALEACEDLRGSLILPGFIDTHIHYPQMDIIAGYGSRLMDWLERYAFPAEIGYAERPHAEARAEVFMRTLFRHGTTSAMVFTTMHEHTTDCLFGAAQRHSARIIAGKVLMNRNAPAQLCDPDDGQEVSARLLNKWHGKDRLRYAITPRFAITSTDRQLAGCGELLEQYPQAYLHTHLAEQPDEIDATAALFPAAKNYVDVYDRFGLLGPTSVFAHGIHLSSGELARLADTGSGIAHCPSSNLFLGSGLLSRAELRNHQVRMSVASDVGGGTSFSMLTTLADGYKVGQLTGQPWHPFNALHAITRGNACALGLAENIGQIAEGFEADLTVLRPPAGSMLDQRLHPETTLVERLFAAFFMAGDDAIERTYVAGKKVFQRER